MAALEGHRDLNRALELVSGRPFDDQRPNGWSWLIDTGDEHHMTAMIADTALTVTTRCLVEKDLARARAAAEIAVLAAPYEETTQMALACVNGAEGNADEAARILREQVYNRVDEADVPPEDLSERTRAILEQPGLASQLTICCTPFGWAATGDARDASRMRPGYLNASSPELHGHRTRPVAHSRASDPERGAPISAPLCRQEAVESS